MGRESQRLAPMAIVAFLDAAAIVLLPIAAVVWATSQQANLETEPQRTPRRALGNPICSCLQCGATGAPIPQQPFLPARSFVYASRKFLKILEEGVSKSFLKA